MHSAKPKEMSFRKKLTISSSLPRTGSMELKVNLKCNKSSNKKHCRARIFSLKVLP